MKQKEFNGANKPRKYLAWQLGEKKTKKKIVNKIILNEETIVYHQAIKRVFYNYYANLFKEKTTKSEDIEKYLKSVDIPEISEHINQILNESITNEVEKAIEDMKDGKPPRPNGITSKFYKVLK